MTKLPANFGDDPEDFLWHHRLAVALQGHAGLSQWEKSFLFSIKHQSTPPSAKQWSVLACLMRKTGVTRRSLNEELVASLRKSDEA